MDAADLLTLAEFEARAEQTVPRQAWDYAAGASGSETTLNRNRRALDQLAIEQRILVDVRQVNLRTSFLGVELPSPIVVAPMGGLFRLHPEGDVEMARGTGRDGSMMVISGVTGWPIAEIAAATTGPLMFQLYHFGDRDWVQTYLDEVVSAGVRLICLTVDVPLYSRRERDIVNRFSGQQRRVAPRPGTQPEYPARLTWDDARWLRKTFPGPFGLKGILHADDAARALDEGVDFIWVSNHGGRQLDDARATIDGLQDVADVVKGRVPIIVDGGFRRGTDVLKGLARGANLVAMGRTPLWGLAAAGAEGVAQTLHILQEELRLGLAFAGQTSVLNLPRTIVRTVDY